MATAAQWLEGARPRTLPMAVAPVIIGTAAAYDLGSFKPLHAVLAALVAMLLQVGVNYANDYSDGIRGTDDNRVGPLRLTGSGAAPAKQVKYAAFACFGVAMVAGLALIILSSTWFLILVGVGCVAAAWGYTGGRNPYGYMGLGDIFVFVFFGLVATLGTTYTQAGQVSVPALIGAVGTGLIAMALLMANNVRDIPTDREAGKRTLAVRLGDEAARISYVMMLALAILLPLFLAADYPWVLLVLLLIPACLMPSWLMLKGKKRRSLIPVLQQTGLINLGFALLYSLGLVLTRVLA
ncbi:1,4-dihydroxy-2-naphthoate polyprenyltransferase [Arthrobacter sp. zg-Y820]|uniref:1,4-dihydroxy-2-naphthoate polyprenyltransferase n=1 Tax=unclassified Arthrobacter TaxID=235627 RepID=UPI002540FAC1|nr:MULTISPECIES: 1,4-dihydroxy-2-naphthoate polyprenyltransferase [unclassified Arthrobacter]MCC9195605.1 1,4-dihydroxy-2-naphthoate polyprenyltransferase [Arthrobacter sp. zg-Y820]MDK1278464.1 1,4-dihydroxy-2-naphthoate polyprenyltransferase [Arthrobacter sp. zg.Y820]MDK1359931.1 1,4-dihydroxy-2-naphthoate polyprenyltransferase [Arthrobacter sp. zg-Y1219]WIB09098.1 1,4-dihydroxy-2-naphthoate polyprenyltransferase [Arthrobacter sp. zg-Y820]